MILGVVSGGTSAEQHTVSAATTTAPKHTRRSFGIVFKIPLCEAVSYEPYCQTHVLAGCKEVWAYVSREWCCAKCAAPV